MQSTLFALIGPLGLGELLIIFAIIMLIYGGKRLPGLAQGLGQAIRGFKDEVKPKDEPAEPRRDA